MVVDLEAFQTGTLEEELQLVQLWVCFLFKSYLTQIIDQNERFTLQEVQLQGDVQYDELLGLILGDVVEVVALAFVDHLLHLLLIIIFILDLDQCGLLTAQPLNLILRGHKQVYGALNCLHVQPIVDLGDLRLTAINFNQIAFIVQHTEHTLRF